MAREKRKPVPPLDGRSNDGLGGGVAILFTVKVLDCYVTHANKVGALADGSRFTFEATENPSTFTWVVWFIGLEIRADRFAKRKVIMPAVVEPDPVLFAT